MGGICVYSADRLLLVAMTSPRKTCLTPSDVRFKGSASFMTARERGETLSLIRRLTRLAGIAVADLALSAVTLEPLTGGRSVARVFKLTPFFGSGRQVRGAPVVLKIAPRTHGIVEKTNYDRFVRWALPADCRPDLLAFGHTRTHAGLCYSFAGHAGARRLVTLTDCLRRGDATKVELVLRKIFEPMRETWYRPALLRRHSDIEQRYLERFFSRSRSVAENEATLGAYAARYFNARKEGGRYRIGRQSFPSPLATLFTSGRKRMYRSCIVHGDLNSDNLVVSDDPAGVMVVDFEKTGRGHVHEDLIFVEASVRINFVTDTSFVEIPERERLIVLGRPPHRRDPYAASILGVRDTASRYFGKAEYEANYHFAVAATGLRLMQSVDLSDVARARITAATLWAAKVLAGEI
jgi:hypothetical protein